MNPACVVSEGVDEVVGTAAGARLGLSVFGFLQNGNRQGVDLDVGVVAAADEHLRAITGMLDRGVGRDAQFSFDLLHPAPEVGVGDVGRSPVAPTLPDGVFDFEVNGVVYVGASADNLGLNDVDHLLRSGAHRSTQESQAPVFLKLGDVVVDVGAAEFGYGSEAGQIHTGAAEEIHQPFVISGGPDLLSTIVAADALHQLVGTDPLTFFDDDDAATCLGGAGGHQRAASAGTDHADVVGMVQIRIGWPRHGDEVSLVGALGRPVKADQSACRLARIGHEPRQHGDRTHGDVQRIVVVPGDDLQAAVHLTLALVEQLKTPVDRQAVKQAAGLA